jgi:hypothetical protein
VRLGRSGARQSIRTPFLALNAAGEQNASSSSRHRA